MRMTMAHVGTEETCQFETLNQTLGRYRIELFRLEDKQAPVFQVLHHDIAGNERLKPQKKGEKT